MGGRPGADAEPWREVAEGVLVRRHSFLDVTVTLVLGAGSCLLVDSGGSEAMARDLLGAVRRVTALPVIAVTTHAHFDHCLGHHALRTAYPGCPIWAHPTAIQLLTGLRGKQLRRDAAAWLRNHGWADAAVELEVTPVLPPDHPVTRHTTLDLGDRRVDLWHPGRGHTDHDVVVAVPDASVSVLGDLVEEGAPPDFDDAWPLEWPVTLTELAPALGCVVVPGHGAVMTREAVLAQRDEHLALAELAEELLPARPGEGHGSTADRERAAERARRALARLPDAALPFGAAGRTGLARVIAAARRTPPRQP